MFFYYIHVYIEWGTYFKIDFFKGKYFYIYNMDISSVKKLSKIQKIELLELIWSDLFGDNNVNLSVSEKRMLDERARYASAYPEKLKSLDEVFEKLLNDL